MAHYCNCNRCISQIESTAAAIVGGVLQIMVVPLQAYKDYEYYGLTCVCRFRHIQGQNNPSPYSTG